MRSLETAEMRRLGYWVVRSRRRPGTRFESMQTLFDVGLANVQHGDHPRYFHTPTEAMSFVGLVEDSSRVMGHSRGIVSKRRNP